MVRQYQLSESWKRSLNEVVTRVDCNRNKYEWILTEIYEQIITEIHKWIVTETYVDPHRDIQMDPNRLKDIAGSLQRETSKRRHWLVTSAVHRWRLQTWRSTQWWSWSCTSSVSLWCRRRHCRNREYSYCLLPFSWDFVKSVIISSYHIVCKSNSVRKLFF